MHIDYKPNDIVNVKCLTTEQIQLFYNKDILNRFWKENAEEQIRFILAA